MLIFEHEQITTLLKEAVDKLSEEEQTVIDNFYLSRSRAPIRDSKEFLKQSRQLKTIETADVHQVRESALDHLRNQLEPIYNHAEYIDTHFLVDKCWSTPAKRIHL